jgi:hypothetical protein
MTPELINVVRMLKHYDTKQNEYLDTIPSDINSVFFDNTFVDLLARQKDLLIEHLFGEHAEDVTWFLYEFSEGKTPGPHCRLADGTEYTYNTNEDYYEYLKGLKE